MTKDSWFFCGEFKTSMNLLASSSSIGCASSGVSWNHSKARLIVPPVVVFHVA